MFSQWTEALDSPLKLNTIQGAIIVAGLFFGFAVVIRTLLKLIFSSYHLQRDAEERATLTYLYLSLANDQKMEHESINLVLQALFSRSDSGLLKNDSSPVMPMATEIFNKGTK